MQPEAVTRSLYEFLVTYIHAIAYIGEVYPKESFALKRQYDIATYENNHPGVKLWAESAAKSVMELIYSTTSINRQAIVSIIILDESTPIERYGITVSNFEIQASLSQHSQPRANINPNDVSEGFRSCISRLYASTSTSKRSYPNSNRSMTMMFEGDLGDTVISKAWMTAEPHRKNIKPRIYPIRSIEMETGENQVLVLNTFRQSAK